MIWGMIGSMIWGMIGGAIGAFLVEGALMWYKWILLRRIRRVIAGAGLPDGTKIMRGPGGGV